MLSEKISFYSPNTTLFTDGSYCNGKTTYSIVKQISPSVFEPVHHARLPDHTGIFIAEIAALKSAIDYSIEREQRTLICTDSLSATKALIKNTKEAYNHMLYHTGNYNIVILWIPSHIGIEGNECADKSAKDALNLPEISEIPCFPRVISNPFKYLQRQQNPSQIRPKYDRQLSRSQCIWLARLRVGRAVFNTKFYYDHTNPPSCTFCNVYLTIPHLLAECPRSKIDEPLEKILDCSGNKYFCRIKESLGKHNIKDI